MMDTTKDTRGQFTGKHMLLLVVGFFVVIFLMNIALAFFAIGSWPGLLVRNGFDASQTYNQELEQSRIQSELEWKSELKFAREAVVLKIIDKSGNPVKGLSITAAAARPTNEAEDQILEISEAPDGSYVGQAPLTPGNWFVSVHATNQGASKVYRHQFRIFIQP